MQSIPRLAALLVICGALATPALGAVQPQSVGFEVLLGYAMPGPEILENDAFFGLRAGWNAGRHLMFDLELAFQDSKTTFFDDETQSDVTLDYEAFVLDLTAGWNFMPRKRTSLMLYGGFGWVNVTTDVESTGGIRLGGVAEGSGTLHAGTGVRISVTKGSYLRIDYRVRWFDQREEDKQDGEATLAYGWYF